MNDIDKEVERILAMSDEEILRDAVLEYGSERAAQIICKLWRHDFNRIAELVAAKKEARAQGRQEGFAECREMAKKYHQDQAEHAEGRARYFLEGPGWRTHCAGASGAKQAGRDYQKIAQHHSESAKVFEALQPPREEKG